MNAKEEAPSGALKARTTPYVKLHKLVNRLYPRSGRCEHCGATDRRTQYAGKSHDHYTAEREDWLELCGSCHKKYDGQIPVEAIASNVGRSPSAETRAKISAAHMGRRFTPEWRAKIAAKASERTMNAEARAKVGAAQRGKPKSPEHRAKIGAANRKLTDTDVAAIRAEGNPNVRELAARFGVSETTIRRALTGESRLTARRP